MNRSNDGPEESIRSEHAPRAHVRVTVQQALFGYREGHRLLAASCALRGEALGVLSRLTDGTGAESYPGFDGYLSGFPVPGGLYALTRTWAAVSEERPGAVWTHVLLVESGSLGHLGGPRELIKLFRNPEESLTTDRYESELGVPAGGPEQLFDLQEDWRLPLSQLYATDGGTVWQVTHAARDVESDVLALWWWQWPALRRQFAFSLGGTGRRAVAGRDFDLLLVPAARRMSVMADFGTPEQTITAAGMLIDADMRSRMPEQFRAYLRFCGAESQRRTVGGLLADIWLAASDSDVDAAGLQRAATTRVRELFPEPSSMRRLKRTMLVPDERLPARWTLADSAAVLINSPFSDCVRADDVDIDTMLLAVRDEPRLLLRAARRRSEFDNSGVDGSTGQDPAAIEDLRANPRLDSSTLPLTVADVMPTSARAVLAEAAQPTWLEEISQLGGHAVVEVLARVPTGEREPWGRAFWTMGDGRSGGLTATHLKSSSDKVVTSVSLGWLAAYAGSASEGVGWLGRIHTSRHARVAALADLIDELAKFSPERLASWRSVVRNPSLVRAALDLAPRASGNAVVLLLIVDPAVPDALDAGVRPWLEVSPESLDPMTSAHLLRVAMRIDDGSTRLVARAYTLVWEACAHSDWAVWEALADYPAPLGFGQDWDRARRISRRMALVLRASMKDPAHARDIARAVLADVAATSTRASGQLAEELSWVFEDGPSQPQDSPKKRSKGKKRGNGPIEQARQFAADWLRLG